MSGDDKPGDPLASLGDEIALGYGEGIAAAIMGQFRDPESRSSGRVAFCAPGNEMLAAVACALHGEKVTEVRAHPYLTGDDCFVVDFDALPPPGPFTL